MIARLCLLITVVAPVFLSGCFLPKKDPKLVAKIDAAFQKKGTVVLDAAGWIPWEVGHWALIASEDSKGNRSLVEYSIVAKEGDGFWLQTVTTNPDRESETQLLVEGYDAKDLKKTVIRRMRMRDQNGEIQEYNRDAQGGGFMALAMGAAISMADGVLASMRQTEAASVPEDITVPAGTVKGARKTPVGYTLPMGRGEGHNWYALVPAINFAQQIINVTTMGFTITVTSVLVDFGKSGAKDRFLPEKT